jgi:hypothetical protein
MPLRGGIFGSSRAWAHASRFSHTPASAALCLPESARDSVQLIVKCTTLCALLFAWQHDVGYLHRWRLARQRKHLVNGNTGSDRCIAQPSFADRFLHATRAQLRNIAQDPDDAFFSDAYIRGFATFDSSDSLSGDVTPPTNFICGPSLTE